LEDQFWVPVLKTLGSKEKSNMKMGQNLDPRLKEIFGCRILEILKTNS